MFSPRTQHPDWPEKVRATVDRETLDRIEDFLRPEPAEQIARQFVREQTGVRPARGAERPIGESR